MIRRSRMAAGVLAVLALPFAAAAGVPTVVSVSPVSQRIDAPRHGNIQVVFSEAIDSETVDVISFRVFGRWSGPATGLLSVSGAVVTFLPDEPFFAGEWVTVSLSKAIKSLTGDPMAQGYAWNYWTAAGAGTTDLDYVGRVTVRGPGETWVQVYGAYGGDVNNDGWSDLTAPCEQTDDARVFLNDNGSITSFVKETLPDGAVPSPNEGADFDNDGEIDVVIANTQGNYVSLMFGDGTGDFPDKTSYFVGNEPRGVGVLDLNGDGWEDIVTAHRGADYVGILLNNGDGTFADVVGVESGRVDEWALAVADANNDGLLDVFCATAASPYYVIVLLGDGNGGLVAQPSVAAGGKYWQLVVGDFNNDGNVDVTGCDTAGSSNTFGVLLGDGAGGLGAATKVSCGSFPLAIDCGDVDGDGDLEIVTSNYSTATWTVRENVAGAFLNPITLNASSSGSCAVLHDRDNDGDLDITGLDETDDWLYFYDNPGVPTSVGPFGVATRLLQNHPNPFNPSTTIRFELAAPALVDLTVYDVAGAQVATLAGGPYAAGKHDVRWNGVNDRGERTGSGVYFYRLTAGDVVLTRKMVLLK